MWRLLPISFAVAVAVVSALIFYSAADSITDKLCSDRPNSLSAPCSTGVGEVRGGVRSNSGGIGLGHGLRSRHAETFNHNSTSRSIAGSLGGPL